MPGVKRKAEEKEEYVCTICKEDLEANVGETCIAQCCQAAYHDTCLYLWVSAAKAPSCPACRTPDVECGHAEHRAAVYREAVVNLQGLLRKSETQVAEQEDKILSHQIARAEAFEANLLLSNRLIRLKAEKAAVSKQIHHLAEVMKECLTQTRD